MLRVPRGSNAEMLAGATLLRPQLAAAGRLDQRQSLVIAAPTLHGELA